MKYMKDFLRRFERFKKPRYFVVLVLVVVIVLVAWFLSRDGESDFETQVVTLGNVAQIVSETGITQAVREVDLQFEQSGRVTRVLVNEGDRVRVGSVLIELDRAEQNADVLSAQANLKAEEASLANLLANAGATGRTDSNLLTTKQQQEVIVQNAYSKLLSEGLIAEPSSESYTQTPPIVSGRYLGDEGEYKIIIRRGQQINDYEINVFGLETVRDLEISDTGPTALGTRGLFITFPDTIETYIETTWYVSIPNIKSSSYLANFNAYQAAKEGASVTLNQTETTVEGIIIQESRIDQARASLTTALSNLNKTTLRAPFTGVVTAVDIEAGEIAPIGQTAVSLIADDKFEIKVDIPEADIANVEVGDQAKVTFDAYDDDEFDAEVVFIAPAARLVEGVPSFETTLIFLGDDDKIRSGLSADVEILAAEVTEVLFVPSRALIEKDGQVFVRVLTAPQVVKEQAVVIGLKGSDGMVEIKDGLTVGDEVITFISEEVLAELGINTE